MIDLLVRCSSDEIDRACLSRSKICHESSGRYSKRMLSNHNLEIQSRVCGDHREDDRSPSKPSHGCWRSLHDVTRVVVEGKSCGGLPSILAVMVRQDPSVLTTSYYVFYLVGTLLGRYRLIRCKIRLSRYFTVALFMTIIWRSEILF